MNPMNPMNTPEPLHAGASGPRSADPVPKIGRAHV